MSRWRSTWLYLLVTVVVEVAVCTTKCYRNINLGEGPENVYYCYDDTLPECCQQDATFTCCETSSRKNLREQLQLWGTVTGFVLIIIFVFLCCKYDYSICNDDRPLVERVGLRKAPELRTSSVTPTHDVYSYKQTYDNRFNNRLYERLPPLPPLSPRPGEMLSRGDYLREEEKRRKGGKANEAFEYDEDLLL
ncbi:uncharacterized protein LOC112560517 [Pomacea canaliculata]|nr:uncharacterized protein LOC112560517 [Pomacea canaliculata]XP_025088219.1 uncharacterized protein LOC112560517 [Pomacea canaliculata]